MLRIETVASALLDDAHKFTAGSYACDQYSNYCVISAVQNMSCFCAHMRRKYLVYLHDSYFFPVQDRELKPGGPVDRCRRNYALFRWVYVC